MAWLINRSKALMVGSNVADLFDLVTQRVGNGAGVLDRLKTLVANPPSTDVETLARYLLGEQVDAGPYRRFIVPLKLLEGGTAEERWFGWGDLTFDAAVAGGSSLTLGIKGDAAIGFEILADDDVTPEALDEALIRFKVAGRLSGSFAASAGALGTSLSMDVQRSLSWLFGYDQNSYTFQALGNALTRVAQPFHNFDDVLDAFNGPPLAVGPVGDVLATQASMKSLTYAGTTGFKGASNAKLDVGSVGGTVEAAFKAFANLEHDFKVTIAVVPPAVPAAPAVALDVQVELNKSEERGYDLSLRYSLGLSSLAPGLAPRLLGKLDKVKGVLDKIDNDLDKAEKKLAHLLKPGDWLKQEIADKVAAFADTADGPGILDDLLKEVLGAGTGDSAAKRATDWLADVIDDLSKLPLPGVLNTARDEILKGISDPLQAKVRAFIEQALAMVSGRIDSAIDELALRLDQNILSKALGSSVSNIKKAIGELLNQMRSLLDKVVKAVEQANQELIAINWSRSRRRTANLSYGAHFRFDATAGAYYRDLVLLPDRTLPLLLSATPAGVTLISDQFTGKFSDLTEEVFGLNILSFGISARTKLLTELEVTVIGGVVTIDAKGTLEKTQTFGDESRSIVISNFTSIGTESKSRFQINFSQTEENWNLGEAVGFINGFAQNGVDVDDVARDEIMRYYETKRQEPNIGGKFNPVFSALLNIDDAAATRLIRAAAQAPLADQLHALAARSMFEASGMRAEIHHWFVATPGAMRTVLWPFLQDLPDMSPAISRKDGKLIIDYEKLLQPDDGVWPKVLKKLYDDAQKSSEKLKYIPLKNFQSTMFNAYDGLRKLRIFFEKANAALDIAESFQANPNRSQAAIESLREEMDQCQKQALAALVPWTGVGAPVGKKLKSLPVAFMGIMQMLAQVVDGGQQPDVFFTLDFGKRGKRTFISNLD